MKAIFISSIVVVFIFICAKFLFLESSPPGLFVDEASIGYNAYSILKTGRDEHGKVLPVYFEAFGDYKNPIFIYSVIPVFLLFGVSVTSLRLVATVWILAALILFAYFIKKNKSSYFVIAVTMLLLVSNPWQFQLSRVAFEVASLPFFIILAVHSFHQLTLPKKNLQFIKKWVSIFALSLGFSFYSYTSARLLAPLFLLTGLFFLRKQLQFKYVLLVGCIFGTCLLPLLLSDSLSSGALTARYKIVGLSYYTTSWPDFTITALKNYLNHFSPQFLLMGGDGNLRHVPAPYGIVLPASLFFIVVGIYHGHKKMNRLFFWWVVTCTLLAPLPSAVTIQSPHVLRSIALLPFLFIFFWFGVLWLEQAKHGMKYLGYLFFVLVAIESLYFLRFYFSDYPAAARPWFDAGTVEAITLSLEQPGPHFLSEKLYPGTYVTAYFAEIRAGSKQSNSSKIYFFDPAVTRPSLPGSYVVDLQDCYVYLNNYFELRLQQQTDAACAFRLE